MFLSQQDVLILDCQATGANPSSGSLLEIGWVRMQASQPLETVAAVIQSYLVQLPAEIEVPRQVSRITGLKTADLVAGKPLIEVWKELMATISGFKPSCPTVIHFAQYEERFLRFLHLLYGGSEPFPFEIICTHQLARRLLPGLPGKGLRAIAGYFGHGVPELRRSAHHVAATAFVWQHIVPLLAEQGILGFDELQRWLEAPRVVSGSGTQFPMDSALRAVLPDRPGVYRMLRSNGDILYVGKATSLKKRVHSYFHKKKASARSRLTMEMLSQAVGLEVTVTGSALEAALLETDLIKSYAPPYNVALRLRDRELAFFSRDLQQSSATAGVTYPLGPLPSVHSFSAFVVIHALLKGECIFGQTEDTESCATLLGILPEYAPDNVCFWAGVDLFRQIHGASLARWGGVRSSMLTALKRLGQQLLLKKLAEMELAAATNASAELIEDEGVIEDETEVVELERVWTPEAVVHMMEGIVRYGATLLRRSCWFCRLSESSLVWESGQTSGQRLRLLLFQEGAVSRQEDWDSCIAVPVPPGYHKSFSARQHSFNIATYDRLRVLTTELRRLVASSTDRKVQLCLGPNIILQQPQLRKLFRWL